MCVLSFWTSFFGGVNLQEADLQRANLEGADLQGAYLQGANLYRANLWEAHLQGAYLYGTEILSFQGDRHFAYCHEDRIQIGCVDKRIEYWVEHYKEIGLDQAYSEQDIEEYGAFIKMCKRRLT